MIDDYFIKEFAKAAYSPIDKEKLVEQAVLIKLPEILEIFSKNLPDTKFLCGDEISIYDYGVGGIFSNLILNSNC